jgi:LPS export ABC transporter protein LptC
VRPTPTHDISEPKITVKDPAGRWTFHVTAVRAEAAVADGLYELEAPECRYERSGEPPVFMRADRGNYDHDRKRLLMEGNAYAWAEGREMVIEAPRIEYDLRTGQVVLDDWTK